MKTIVLLIALCFIAAAMGQEETTKAPDGCEYGGVVYAPGTSYKEDCNTCICIGNDLAACTLMACIGG